MERAFLKIGKKVESRSKLQRTIVELESKLVNAEKTLEDERLKCKEKVLQRDWKVSKMKEMWEEDRDSEKKLMVKVLESMREEFSSDHESAQSLQIPLPPKPLRLSFLEAHLHPESEIIRLKSFEEKVSSLRASIDELHRRTRTENNNLKAQLGEANARIQISEQEIQTQKDEITRLRPLEKEVSGLRASIDELHRRIRTEKNNLKAQLGEANACIQISELEIQTQKDEIARLRPFEKEVSGLRAFIRELPRRTRTRNNNLKAQLGEANARIQLSEREIQTQKDEIAYLRPFEQEVSGLRASIGELHDERRRARTENDELKTQLQEAKNENQALVEKYEYVQQRLLDKIEEVEIANEDEDPFRELVWDVIRETDLVLVNGVGVFEDLLQGLKDFGLKTLGLEETVVKIQEKAEGNVPKDLKESRRARFTALVAARLQEENEEEETASTRDEVWAALIYSYFDYVTEDLAQFRRLIEAGMLATLVMEIVKLAEENASWEL
jgi:hypothetical protein